MPKKHRHSYVGTKPNYVHPTLGGGKRNLEEATAGPLTITVNERLSQLRIAQSGAASADCKREFGELSNQKSLPPSLREGILGFAPTAAPIARPGVRSRIRVRTPGPAPPPSWQSHSTPPRQIDEARYRRAQPGARSFGTRTDVERRRPEQLGRFLNLIEESPIDERSLLHASLRSAAENWDAIVEDCLDDLEYLPQHARRTLLSYLTKYGPPEGVSMRSVQALFPSETDVKLLDFSGLVGWSFTMKELKRWLKAPLHNAVDSAGETVTTIGDTAESWEEEVESDIWTPLTPAITTRIPFLSKLSLAFPPDSISWVDLLSLSKDLGTLTHLSLAYWPIPTRTPNMKTASYIAKSGAEQAAGGTSLYSASDKDFQESTIILRRFSENTYCLRWLDLEGCSEWLPALAWQGASQIAGSAAPSEWERAQSPHGPDWRGSWSNITYLNLSQEWIPQNRAFLNSAAFKGRIVQKYLRLSPVHLQILHDMKTSPGYDDPGRVCEACQSRRDGSNDIHCHICTAWDDHETGKAARWLEREADAWAVGRSVNLARAASGTSRCTFDHGWQRKEAYTKTWLQDG